jgi:hypothetical protein
VWVIGRIDFISCGASVIKTLQILIVGCGLTIIKFMNGRKKLGQQLRHHMESSLCFAHHYTSPPLVKARRDSELQTLDSYFISKKGIYSTADLIEHAEQALSVPIRAKMPAQAITDFIQAGKCLAFDSFTASGFHVLRATDSVLRLYYGHFVGTPPKPKVRN